MCNLKENLWLCLECGNLGCGRNQIGGVKGNSHGLKHNELTNHAVAVKLGSLTAEGTADIYCYACNEERTDPELAHHLAYWGINIADRKKTEKSLTEMQIEQNLKWEFSMTTEDGKEMKPLFGEGFTGLKNLGNSCYLSSILQCLFSIPFFQNRYYLPQEPPPSSEHPAEDLETQLRKLADGLLSGRYSHPDTDVINLEYSVESIHQKGLAPAMLKHLVGRGHEEFSTMRQQDAFELLLHLFKLITRSAHPAPQQDPVQSFRFVMEQRLQCINCRKVRYRTDEQDNISIPVPARRKLRVVNGEPGEELRKDEFEPVTLKECLEAFTDAEIVELVCPACGGQDGFTKRSLFKTFPEILVVNARRFELVNWVPTKLDIPVQVGDDPFDLDIYMSKGLQNGEELLPEDADDGGSSAFVPDSTALSQLEAMGFPPNRCVKALHATGNSDADSAMTWLFAHMDDPDIDDPLTINNGKSKNAASDARSEDIETLEAMGISAPQARKALKETNGDVNRALDWVFSHPDDQGDYGDDGENQNGPNNSISTSIPQEETEKKFPGSGELPAKFQLQSIACHKGASIHAGYVFLLLSASIRGRHLIHTNNTCVYRHYVAFIRKHMPAEGKAGWVLFNDEKVVKAEGDVEEMKKFAYVYFFQRL